MVDNIFGINKVEYFLTYSLEMERIELIFVSSIFRNVQKPCLKHWGRGYGAQCY